MVIQHRTRPPHPNPWDSLTLEPHRPENWLVKNWPIQITNKISSRLKDSLLGVKTIRLLRSTLSEWSTDDEGWQCRRLLGAGAFGVAAQWQRTDQNGNVQDEIVVKEDTDSRVGWAERGAGRHMSPEAYHQNRTNNPGNSDSKCSTDN